MLRRTRLAALLVLAAICVHGDAAGQGPPESAIRVRAHMTFLADDLLEGREAGTRGYDLAARYVAAVMQTYGLQPAGTDGTFFQSVPIRESKRTSGALTLIPTAGSPVVLDTPDDAVVLPDSHRESTEVAAALVYAGFGVTAPELAYDDYKGIDASGKVVVVFSNAPPQFPTERRAHYASRTEKLRNAAEHGAAGVVFALLPSDLKLFAWERRRENASEPQITWLDPEGRPHDYPETLRARAVLGPAGTRRVLAYGPEPAGEAIAAAEKGEPRSFALAASIRIQTSSEHNGFSTPNVVGLLRGSDAGLAGTYVVITAHLDHVGIGRPVNGDAIYNGAFDNAAGAAVLLEVARELALGSERPRRSVLVAFVTAEEKGLVGSDYFARHPTVPAEAIVANVNLDMPVVQWPIADVVAFGAENSTLEQVARRSLARAGLALVPDPLPQENLFVRSDQYSFVKQGVPAIYLFPAFGSKDPARDGEKIFATFLSTHYHQPSDEIDLPIDLGGLATFTRANYLIALAIANDPVAPSWKPGNFFGETFGSR